MRDSRGKSVPVQVLLGVLSELNTVKEGISTMFDVLCQHFCFCLSMKPTPCKQVGTKERDSRCRERRGGGGEARDRVSSGRLGENRAVGKRVYG